MSIIDGFGAVDSDEELQKKIEAFTACQWKSANHLHKLASYIVYMKEGTPEAIANRILYGDSRNDVEPSDT